jgi:hypothetical protein
MTKMVRQQMFCIIAPEWCGDVAHLKSEVVSKALTRLFSDVGVVHFATVALLPAMPRGKPSLMLEIVVEEGLTPCDLLSRLVHHPGDALWPLFNAHCPANERTLPPSQRNGKLLDRLIKWHHVADGGFVGARDRSVRQIKMERHLLDEARAATRKLKVGHTDRASLALALARWAFADERFEWARKPAPRSYWRSGSGLAKVALLLFLAGLVVGLVWIAGFLAGLVADASRLKGSFLQAVFSAVSETSRYLLCASWRLMVAVSVLLLIGWMFFSVLPALFPAWRRWLQNLRRELDRPTQTASSLLTSFIGWVVGVPLVLAAVASVFMYTFTPWHFERVVKSVMPASPGLKHYAIAAGAILLLLGIGALAFRLERTFPKLSALFYRPGRDDVPGAQQVHPSIEACEARLASGTAHMISLTDLRRPYRWSAWWTRLMQRLATLLGRVIFTEGRLGGAPGIHFAHWHIIDDGRRFLFCANFDGSFGGYLDDFINCASMGTTLFWRWTELGCRQAAAVGQPDVLHPRAFPPTRFAMFRGVKCELKFKSYARDSMLPHLYRFDACKLSMDDIDRATGLRDALFGERSERNDDLIMRIIEA